MTCSWPMASQSGWIATPSKTTLRVERQGHNRHVENAQLADRLDAFAALLELAEANPYTTRAYRRAADTIRGAPLPVEGLVRSGRVRELRGIGPGIEARLRELIETGQIGELVELERELAPDLVGLGRFLGLSARRSIELARTLDVHTAEELRDAAAEGRLRGVPGIGPKTEARLLEALARNQSRERQGLLLNRARDLVGAIAQALDGEPAGDVRRWRDSCEYLAVVCATRDPQPLIDRFKELPQIVAMLESGNRQAVGVTIEGVPIELLAAEPERFGTALVRATGSPRYVSALEPLPDAPDERTLTDGSDSPGARPSCERSRSTAILRHSSSRQIRGDLHCHTTWSDGRASVAEMGRAALELGYEYLAICDHTPAVGAVRGLPRTTSAPGRGDRRRQRAAGAVPGPARDRVRHPARRASRPSGRCARGARLGSGERARRAADAGGEMTAARGGGAAQPIRTLPQPPEGPLHQPTPRERARPRPSVRGRSRAPAWRSRSTAYRIDSISAASTCAMRSRPGSGSYAPPTRTRSVV